MSTNGMISNSGGSLLRQRATGLYPPKLPASIWALAATTLVLGLVYAPNFHDLYSTWNNDPNYSHGYLVIPIALLILWRRLSKPQTEQPSSDVPAPWWGWVFLAGTLAVRAIAYERNLQWVETATIVPAIALYHLDFRWLAAIAPGLASDRLPCLLASLAGIRKCIDWQFRCSLSPPWAVASCFSYLDFGRSGREPLSTLERPMVPYLWT